MVTASIKTGDVTNAAVAAILREEAAGREIIPKTLAQMSGVPYHSLLRIMRDERAIRMGQLLAICDALDLDPAKVVKDAAARVAKSSPNPTP